MKITFPKNNRWLNEAFNTINEKEFNYTLLNKILLKTEKILPNYELEFISKYKKDGTLKDQKGQYIIIETKYKKRYVLISAKSAMDTRNGYVAAKMPLCVRAWYYDKTNKEKTLEIYLMDVESQYCVNSYNTFIYIISKAYGVDILNGNELPYLKYDNRKHKYRKRKVLYDLPIKSVKEIKKARDDSQKKNIGNNSSYILESEDFIIIYAKVDANSEFEMVYIACVVAVLAKKEKKEVFLYQVEEKYSDSIGKENKKLLQDHGITIFDTLEEYNANPDLILDESKTSRNQAEFYKNLLEKYNNGSDYKKCYFCGSDFQDLLVASHIQRVTDINNLAIPFCEKRKKAVDPDNGFWLCPTHDKYLENGYIYFENDEMKISDKISDEKKNTILQSMYISKVNDSLDFGENTFEIITTSNKCTFKINSKHYNTNMHKYLEEHKKRVTKV